MGVTMATAYLAPVHPLRSGPLPPPPHPPPSLGSQTRRGRPRSRLRLPRLRGPGPWSSALKPSANKARDLASANPGAGRGRGSDPTLPTFTRDFLFLRGPSMQSVAMPWKSSSSSLSSSSSSSQPCRKGILSSTEPPRRSLVLSLPAFLQTQCYMESLET